jgi:hypothetical protein
MKKRGVKEEKKEQKSFPRTAHPWRQRNKEQKKSPISHLPWQRTYGDKGVELALEEDEAVRGVAREEEIVALHDGHGTEGGQVNVHAHNFLGHILKSQPISISLY